VPDRKAEENKPFSVLIIWNSNDKEEIFNTEAVTVNNKIQMHLI
jgi:hypothetical protein